MPFSIESARGIFPSTLSADAVPAIIVRLAHLNAEDQLALIWFVYLEMGKTIIVAVPGVEKMGFIESTMNQIREMTPLEQSQVMLDLVNRVDTGISRTYGTWSVNIKLSFWYQLGMWMENGIVAPIPEGYQLSANASAVLKGIRELDFGKQITVLRSAVAGMGYDSGKLEEFKKIVEGVVSTQEISRCTQVKIEGIKNKTVLSYMNNLNANDFDGLIELFTVDGGLQPPFGKPIIGREAVFHFLREECQNLKLMPERGVCEKINDGYSKIKVTGKVETPWFGAAIGMNIAWRFLIDPEGKIFFVGIDLLASPKELLNLFCSN